MAINIKNLIDLPLLEFYDENIKKWAIQEFSGEGSTENVQFTTNSSLPQPGELNTLYITEDSILTWDGNKYNRLNIQDLSWKTFQ